MAGKKKTTNTRSNTGNQDENYVQREPPDPPNPLDRATRSRTWTKTEGADKNVAQMDDTQSASAEHSFAKTTSEVEETPEWQTLLWENTAHAVIVFKELQTHQQEISSIRWTNAWAHFLKIWT